MIIIQLLLRGGSTQPEPPKAALGWPSICHGGCLDAVYAFGLQAVRLPLWVTVGLGVQGLRIVGFRGLGF